MNFLAHHAAARRVDPCVAPEFYVGNVLPDLVRWKGRSLRARHVPQGALDALARGARLHFASDRRFHSDPLFPSLLAHASDLLAAAPLSRPVARRFFLAHVSVELALDGVLLGRDPSLAADLYARLEACDPERIAAKTASWLGCEALPELAGVLRRFLAHRWLENYASASGQAEGLRRIAAGVGVDAFRRDEDPVIARVFQALEPAVAQQAESLLNGAVAVWYNSPDDATVVS